MTAENKHTIEDLKIMQSWSLERKIRVTQTRIMEWYMHYNGNVYVSFSGGKDSTVLLDLARRIYPDIPAVFVDTGLEYPEIKEFVKSQDNITILRPKKIFRQVVLEYGYPVASKEIAKKIYYYKKGSEWTKKYIEKTAIDKQNRLSRYCISERWLKLVDAPFKVSSYCCDVMKKQPLHSFSKKTGAKPIVGTMAGESLLRTRHWLYAGCNSFENKHQISKPMSFWTEQDVLQYLKQFNIPYCSVYGDIVENTKGKLYTTKCDRTGCVFCGFGCTLEKSPNRFQSLKQTHPKLHEYCMKPIDAGGLGMKEVLDYIGVPYE